MNPEVWIAFGAAALAAAVLYLEFGRTDPCVTMNELATRYAAPLSEGELQAIATENKSLEAAVQRKRAELQRMYEAMPVRVAQQYTTATHGCARSFR